MLPASCSGSVPRDFAWPILAVGRRAVRQDGRDGRERDHVVDDGRRAEQALLGGQRRAHADLAAAALEAFEHRGFLAADVGAGAEAHLHVEGLVAVQQLGTEETRLARQRDRGVQHAERMRILDAQVHVALRRADRDARDRHALDQRERVAFHQHAVREGARVALVGIAGDVLLAGRLAQHGLPLDAGREGGAAAAAQARLQHFVDRRLRPEFQRAREARRSRRMRGRRARSSGSMRPTRAKVRRCCDANQGCSSIGPIRSACAAPFSNPFATRSGTSRSVTGP